MVYRDGLPPREDEHKSEQPVEKKELGPAHWEHFCDSCELKGSTSFQEGGDEKDMDVYTCTDHSQPGIYGGDQKNLGSGNDVIVVRYAPASSDTIGEISVKPGNIDIDELRGKARNRKGRTDHTPVDIAIGKIL